MSAAPARFQVYRVFFFISSFEYSLSAISDCSQQWWRHEDSAMLDYRDVGLSGRLGPVHEECHGGVLCGRAVDRACDEQR